MLTHADELLLATARGAFWQSFDAYPDMLGGLVARLPSDAPTETYPWFAYAPSPSEMQGSRRSVPVPELTWTIRNRMWESTVTIDYPTRRFNRLNSVANLLGEMGAKARAFPNKLATDELISLGHSTACYDTQFFFDTDHVDPGAPYSTSQDNDLSYNAASTTVLTDLEMADIVRNSIQQFYTFKDGFGDPQVPLADEKFVVMVPAGFQGVAERVERVESLTGPVGNDMRGRFTTRVNPWLAAPGSDPAVYVFRTQGPRKAFIWQEVDPVSLTDDMGGDNDFATKDVNFGTFGYWNIGFGDWRYAIRTTIT